MKNPSGTAPVYLHELLHGIMTCPAGSRPKPVSENSEVCKPVPVVAVVCDDDGVGFTVPLDHWRLDANGKPRLVLALSVPPGWKLVAEGPPAEAPATSPEVEREPVVVPWTRPDGPDEAEVVSIAATRAANGLPEVTDPGAIQSDPERLMECLKANHKERKVGAPEGNKGDG